MCVNVNNYISQPMRFWCLPDCQPQGQIQDSWKEVHVYKGGGGGGGVRCADFISFSLNIP